MANGNPVLAAAVAAVVAAAVGAVVVTAMRAPEETAPPPPPPAAPAPDLSRRVEALERCLAEATAAVEALRKENAAAREESARREAVLRAEIAKEKENEQVDPARTLMSGYAGDPRTPGEEKKAEPMDAFAKALAKSMRQGMSEELRKSWELIVNPSPEALDARRRQMKMFAATLGTSAGLDQAQIATFERILNDADDKARDDLRPLIQGQEDYRNVDYKQVRKITDDSFAAQNEQFDKEFPRDKSDRLKRQLEPIRNLFGAAIDELGKQPAATPAAEPPK